MDIQHSIKLALRHPESTASLMAATISRHLGGAPWIDSKTRFRFCMLFIANSIDGSVEKDLDPEMLDKLEEKPLTFGIRYLKRDPHTGLRVLVALITRELRDRQQLTTEEQRHFFETLVERFFPDVKFVDDTGADGAAQQSATVSTGVQQPTA